ncbi:MAG: hypothetical protein ACRC2R_01225 [Xenococcaceae cyanobacterium]
MIRIYASPTKTTLANIDTLSEFYGISRAAVTNVLITEALRFHLDRIEKSLLRQQQKINSSEGGNN